jgi:mono/diheme cytochrome c family protein
MAALALLPGLSLRAGDGTLPVRYQPDIQPIMSDHCVSCHGGQVTSPDLSSKEDVVNHIDQILSRTTPDGGDFHALTRTEYDMIQLWDDEGFPD